MKSSSSLCLAATLALLLLLLCGKDVEAQNHNGPIRTVEAGGTYFSVGYQVGHTVGDIITRRLNFSDYSGCWAWLQNSTGGQYLNASLFNATQAAFPELIEELQGVSEGSLVPFAKIWMMNIVDELFMYERFLPPSERATNRWSEHHHHYVSPGCTDVFTNEDTTPAWGHNEDSGIFDQNNTYIVQARIYNNDSKNADMIEEFVSYCYAGTVAGKAYQWNAHGLLMSFNALFPKKNAFADPNALPRAIHNRVVLRAKTVEEAIQYSTAMPSVTGYSINIGYANKNVSTGRKIPYQFATYRNVEVYPLGLHAVTDIYPNPVNATPWPGKESVPQMPRYFFHTNDYSQLNVPYIVDGSSVARLQRLNEMPIPLNSTDVRNMLGDTKNPSHPVYRHGTQGGYTLSTVVYDFSTYEVLIFNTNPKNTTHLMSYPMKFENNWN